MNGTGNEQDISAETVPQLTLGRLIDEYMRDRVSGWRDLRYHTRKNHESLLARMQKDHGDMPLSEIRRRTLKEWNLEWSADRTKVAMGHAMMSKLRTLCNYGAGDLEDMECVRILAAFRRKGLVETSPSKKVFMTYEQAEAICAKAHEYGYHSIALAQAFQFDLVLRQKDLCGEWVPVSEPGESNVVRDGWKWLRGIRWNEISGDLVLTHITSKRQKPLTVNLTKAPMVHREILLYPDWMKTPDGPLVICESTSWPWSAAEFRRKWRAIADDAGVPADVKNRHSRHGGITEGTKAGVPLERMSKAATHSDIKMTAIYDCDTQVAIEAALEQRVASRPDALKGED